MIDQLVIESAKGITTLVQANADLRRQLAELRQMLALVVDDERKFVEFYRTDADEGYAICNFCKSSHMDEYQIDHHPKCPIAQARAALARARAD